MGKTRRRGGAIAEYLNYANPFNWGKSIETIKSEKCAKKREALDKECSPGESVAPQTNEVAQNAAEASGAPPATTQPTPTSSSTGGRSRRRRSTRRKYKGGKHRKGHRA
jgi:hypothetical protein